MFYYTVQLICDVFYFTVLIIRDMKLAALHPAHLSHIVMVVQQFNFFDATLVHGRKNRRTHVCHPLRTNCAVNPPRP